MNTLRTLIYGILFIGFIGCGNTSQHKNLKDKETTGKTSELSQRAMSLFGKPLPAVAKNPDNQITEAKVELGRMLYFDKRLSKDNTQSCNTCHNLNTFGVDNNPRSEGNNGGLGDRNSPTTLNAALHFSQFWDGREPDVEAQAGGPILNPAEMAMPSEAEVVNRLSSIKEYADLFSKAFPGDQQAITFENLKMAIGAFERKLLTPSRFDEYLAGNEDALTEQEKHGLQTFMDVGCPTCHTGNLLGGNLYQKFGLYDNYWNFTNSEKIDSGRYSVTKNKVDQFMFKVPSLRNIEMTAPYFHDGSIADLKKAVTIMGEIQLNKELTETEKTDIISFLKTLTGELPSDIKQDIATMEASL